MLIEVKNICLTKNYEFLDEEYFGSKFKHNIKCLKCKYSWKIRINDIQNGYGCPSCANKIRFSLEEVKAFCETQNLIFLDEFYNGVMKYCNLQCKICNHAWKTKINTIKNGHNCPNCFIRRLRLSIDEIHDICLKANVKFLDNVYNSLQEVHKIKCLNCNEIWETTIDIVKYKLLKSCKMCHEISVFPSKKYTLEETKNSCLKENIEFLDEKYLGVGKLHKVKCLTCHYIWNCRVSDIKRHHGCPKCSSFKNEKLTG